ncbi:multidrug efflux pump subunit AcrB [Pedobacter sp. W3I1]|uniref:efflux RND transporter permease subunit n=1 Tax=Pedobacter sp. W3I1 TaxID=3042291 RepID=UPI00277EB799|nr:efflux RND transporter permease subunit [Pedobacter sp. W3I1]MDQ0640226.1 multidrug efflux pump subunit AcrB [Pedobacter sp. W3I1]
MVRYLLTRPIGVMLTCLVMMVFGVFLFFHVPVSLLPDISIPEIVVKVRYPNASAEEIERDVTSLLRNSLSTVDYVEDIQCQSTNNAATLTLKFAYKTRMDLANVQVNEKLDRLISSLPDDMERPEVIKLSTSDVPIVRLQVIPKPGENYNQISELTERVIKKRLEQIEGVSMVDINGRQQSALTIVPKKKALQAVGLNELSIANAIRENNKDLGSLSVKDGQYIFHVRINQEFGTREQILSLPLRIRDGSHVPLGKLADVEKEVKQAQGYHVYNGLVGLVITIHKHPAARMNRLEPKIKDAMAQFSLDYPNVSFYLTQDQNFLLEEGIGNLNQDLIYGGFFCLLLLFLFLGNYQSPILMGISIPISLIITAIFFYLFGISFNIISLSGLTLGVGMLIDNSIVVLESITRKRKLGLSIDESCIQGVNEVMSPVIGNVLTTVAIYAPLIFLNGLAGSLIFDQAIALTISLGVSLLVAFCLNPVLYKVFMKTPVERLKDDTILYKGILKRYTTMMDKVFAHRRLFLMLAFLVMPMGFFLARNIRVETLPTLSSTESIIKIDWKDPIDVEENRRRTELLTSIIQTYPASWEADIGIDQFILSRESGTIQNSQVYFKTENAKVKSEVNRKISKFLAVQFPTATFQIENAPNAFTKIFDSNEPYLEVRFRQLVNMSDETLSKKIDSLFMVLPTNFKKDAGFNKETGVQININTEKALRYGVSREAIKDKLNSIFGAYRISKLKTFGEEEVIQLSEDNQNIAEKLSNVVVGRDSAIFQLRTFIDYHYDQQMKSISSDRSGQYFSVSYESSADHPQIERNISMLAKEKGFSASFTGSKTKSRKLMMEMLMIAAISLLLLYLILAIQFEHLLYPLIVMLTIPIGFSGSVFVLWLAGGSFDIMAAIGFIVVFGIIVDDPSLKVETINRLRREYAQDPNLNSGDILLKAIRDAGKICLKPLLMVSLTTSLALIPVFFSDGIGNELQRPLAYVIVGGLTIGTFFTLWFIPLTYLLISSGRKKILK